MCRVEFPDEARRADLSSSAIGAAATEDLPYFSNLAYLDLGINAAPLEPLGALPALRELRMHCNRLRTLEAPLAGFEALEVLGLSYNALEPAAVAALGLLPRLRELDLSRNELEGVPDGAVGAAGGGHGGGMAALGFRRLEVLALGSNRLQGDRVLGQLGTLPRLRLLSLERNFFTGVPAGATARNGATASPGTRAPARWTTSRARSRPR